MRPNNNKKILRIYSLSPELRTRLKADLNGNNSYVVLKVELDNLQTLMKRKSPDEARKSPYKL